jgi:AraC-like DNA-binding protein
MRPAPRKIVHDDVFRRLCRARDYIQAAHAEPLTLERVATKAGLSPYHFQRMFAQAFAETPHEYLTRIRLDRAKALLMTEHLPVTDVCLEVGFSSLGSFSSMFTRHVGQTPSAYRRDMGRIWRIPWMYPRIVVPHCFAHGFFGLPPVTPPVSQ